MRGTPAMATNFTPTVKTKIRREDALDYHSSGRKGKIEVVPTKPCGTARELSLAYSPGVAEPVMEGKGVLFKKFADIDVYDIELAANDVDTFCASVKALEPTFGGINLEDVKAPDCFVIEERLRREMQIPVFHDDQHGTAIISGAALLNGLEVAGKRIDKVRIVISGAGASALACAKFYLSLGVKRENVLLVDTKGVLYQGRADGMNPWKEGFAAD